jgi:hypothetical protein
MNSMKFTTIAAGFLAIAAIALASLMLPTASAQQGNARVRVLHASPDAPAVDVFVDGSKAISNLAFNAATDYVSLTAGAHNVKVFPTSANGTGTPVIAADLTLAAGKDYTVAALGKLANIEPLVLEDNNAAPASGKAKLRFVHASPDAPAVDIFAQGAGVVVPNAAFKQASGYLELAAATYNLEVRAAGTTTVALNLPNITLEAGKTYTAFATGLLQGTPALGAKLTVDAAAQAASPTPAPTSPPANLPTSGGAPGAGNSASVWLLAIGLAMAGAGIGGATIALKSVRSR